MTIKLTDEMINVYDNAPDKVTGLRAVLVIAERDLPPLSATLSALAKLAYERGQRDERALTALLGPPCYWDPEVGASAPDANRHAARQPGDSGSGHDV